MSAFAYCIKCNTPIYEDDYTVNDITTGTYECINCQTQNIVLYTLDDFLQNLVNRVTELEGMRESL